MRKPLDLRDAHKVYLNKFILISFSFVFIAMASGLLFQNLQAQLFTSVRAASHGIQAGDLSVVGQPSLPAATVDTIFKSMGSPMTGTGQVVVQASRQSNIDDAFALAVWWTETSKRKGIDRKSTRLNSSHVE